MTDKQLEKYVNETCGETDYEIYQWYCGMNMRKFDIQYTANGKTERCVVRAKNQADALMKILWANSKDGVHIGGNCRVSVRPLREQAI